MCTYFFDVSVAPEAADGQPICPPLAVVDVKGMKELGLVRKVYQRQHLQMHFFFAMPLCLQALRLPSPRSSS